MKAIHSEIVTDNKQKVVRLAIKICFSRKIKTCEFTIQEVGDDHVTETKVTIERHYCVALTTVEHVDKVLHGNYSSSGNVVVFNC